MGKGGVRVWTSVNKVCKRCGKSGWCVESVGVVGEVWEMCGSEWVSQGYGEVVLLPSRKFRKGG